MYDADASYNFIFKYKNVNNIRNYVEKKIYNLKTKLRLCLAGVGGFLPAMKQIGNVAALPGIVHVSVSTQP